MVTRKIEFHNLDAIISVGFRVNTLRGIEFFCMVISSYIQVWLLRPPLAPPTQEGKLIVYQQFPS